MEFTDRKLFLNDKGTGDGPDEIVGDDIILL